jgi:hypothetical protein
LAALVKLSQQRAEQAAAAATQAMKALEQKGISMHW